MKEWYEKVGSFTAEWTPGVVYKVYCNDDLESLPIAILEDMQKYIMQVIEKTKLM